MAFQHSLIILVCLAVVYAAPIAKLDAKKAFENITLPESFQYEINYETLGGGVDGDMKFPEGQNPFSPLRSKGVLAAPYGVWPGNVIPYDLSGIPSSAHRDFIVRAMERLMYVVGTPIPGGNNRSPCVYFRPRTFNDQYFVRITHGDGCSGSVGFWPNNYNQITLADPGCFTSGIIQHELIHVLGFDHEQNRPDRDSYVTVYQDNIVPLMEYNFQKRVWGGPTVDQKTSYDYQSLMHYDAYAFTRNGRPTILPKQRNAVIGQRQGLSPIDIAEIRKAYRCQS